MIGHNPILPKRLLAVPKFVIWPRWWLINRECKSEKDNQSSQGRKEILGGSNMHVCKSKTKNVHLFEYLWQVSVARLFANVGG